MKPKAPNPRLMAANIRAIMAQPHAPADDGANIPGRIVAANDSLFQQATFSQPLTTYAVGFRDPNNIAATLEFYAPQVMVSPRFEYMAFSNAEEFLSELTDDIRSPRADFKNVEYTSAKVQARTYNRGLRIVVDADEVKDDPTWQQRYTAKLIRRIQRNSLRRSVALLGAAAVNTAKTWGNTADPDQDLLNELLTANTASGIAPNRVAYGHTAATKRKLALRSQLTAGTISSAPMSDDELAAFLGVDQVLTSRERFQSAAATKSEVVGNLVHAFYAESGVDQEDASNIKRFVSNTDAGGPLAVYVRQISTKLWEIVVEHYENTVITSTLGIRQLTIS